jgi:hypothetical protein
LDLILTRRWRISPRGSPRSSIQRNPCRSPIRRRTLSPSLCRFLNPRPGLFLSLNPPPAGNLATVTAQGYTFTFSDTDVIPMVRAWWRTANPSPNYSGGGPGLIYGDGYRVLNGIVYVHTKAGLWHGFTGTGLDHDTGRRGRQSATDCADSGAWRGWWVDTSLHRRTAPAIPPSPDGTIVDQPWQPIRASPAIRKRSSPW